MIVPVNRPWQYELNIARSPGLEIGAEIIPVQGADSAAAAYLGQSARASRLAPAGAPGRLLPHRQRLRAGAPARRAGSGRARGPVGFAGLAASGLGDGSVRHAGMVIDRTQLFSHPGSDAAPSIDEFAVALHRDAAVSIDPRSAGTSGPPTCACRRRR